MSDDVKRMRQFAIADETLDMLIAMVRKRAPMTTADIASEFIDIDETDPMQPARPDDPNHADWLTALLATALQRLAEEPWLDKDN